MGAVEFRSETSFSPPLFSVITPFYNSESTLARAVESILEQTERDWELILCDDGSFDSSAKVADSFSDNRIKIVRNRFAKGAAGARKTARFYARGRYIAYLDADDKWLPNHLATVKRCLRNHEAVFCNYLARKVNSKDVEYLLPSSVSKRLLMFSNFIPCLTVCHSSQLLGFEDYPLVRKRNDLALWLAILDKNSIKFKNTGFSTAVYSISDNGLSANKVEAIKFAYLNLRKFNGPFCAILYTFSHFVFAFIKKAMPGVYNALVSKF